MVRIAGHQTITVLVVEVVLARWERPDPAVVLGRPLLKRKVVLVVEVVVVEPLVQVA